MKEYIIFYDDKIMRFFMSPQGLCVSTLANNRFLNSEIIEPDSECDFAVSVFKKTIYVICQTKSGLILNITYNGSMWEKAVLLQGKNQTAYEKNFYLIALGEFMNLFYSITHGDKTLLVHQILDGSYAPPQVIDYITPSMRSFFVAKQITSDATLAYVNKDGIFGTKLYRWSHKSFMPFMPFTAGEKLSSPFIFINENCSFFAGATPYEKSHGIDFYCKAEDGEIKKTHISGTNPDCTLPVILPYNNNIFVSWQSFGNILVAESSDGGMTFKKPYRYLKNANIKNTLFVFDNGVSTKYCYGYFSESTIKLYAPFDVFNDMKNETLNKKAPKTNEEEILYYAQKAGFKKANGWEDDPYVTQRELKAELEKIQKVSQSYREIINELNEKIAFLEKNNE